MLRRFYCYAMVEFRDADVGRLTNIDEHSRWSIILLNSNSAVSCWSATNSGEGVFVQKLNYIHNNPVQEKWQLALCPEEYEFSSAKFYETGIDDFGFLTHFRE